MTFDVDGAVGWIKDTGDDVSAPWTLGWGPNDSPTPAYVHVGNRIRAGEDYQEPAPGALPSGYHCPYQGTWHGPVLTGDIGTSMSAYDIPWAYRPDWSPCTLLDNTQYGGATIESWWPCTLYDIPQNASYLRVSMPVRGNWYTPGSYFFGSESYPNPVAIGKTVQMRMSPTLPEDWFWGIAIGAQTLTQDWQTLKASMAPSSIQSGVTFYIGMVQLPPYYTRGSVHCSLAFDAIDYPRSGGGDSWMVDHGGFTFEWVVSGDPVIFVDGVNIDNLPVIETGYSPSVEVRTARTLLYGGQPTDVDEDHVLLTTPITDVSSIDASNQISLISPTVLPATSFTWKFQMSHTFNDRAQMAQGVVYSSRDYSYDPVSNISFLTFEQSLADPYIEVVNEQENVSVLGGAGDARWEVTTKGYGYATLKVGDWESGRFLVYRDRWYGLTLEYPASGDVSYVLADYTSGDVLASIIYPVAGTPQMVYTGGRAVVFEPDVAVGFDEITLAGTFGDISTETYYPPEPDIGWNIEYVKVENGTFSLEAQPVAGSVKVESFDTGLLDYPEDWQESDDTGINYVCRTDDYLLSVTYLVAMEFLENRVSSPRPEEQEAQQHQRINYL